MNKNYKLFNIKPPKTEKQKLTDFFRKGIK